MAPFIAVADAYLREVVIENASLTTTKREHEFLFREGQKCCVCYLVKSGRLRLRIVSPKGRVIWQDVVGEGSVIGLPAAINGYPCVWSCEAIQDCELVGLSRRDLMNLIRNDAVAGLIFLSALGLEFRRVNAFLASSWSHSTGGFKQGRVRAKAPSPSQLFVVEDTD